ncbi:MAG: hypothetical protein C4320_08990, partial [Armatimonadota bacterium]
MMGTALAGATEPPGGIAQTLRQPVRRTEAKDLPATHRAVVLNDVGPLNVYSLFGLASTGGGSSKPDEAMIYQLLGVMFVDPDEFAELLEGKRLRIRAYTMDFFSIVKDAAGQGNDGRDKNRPPIPVFN